MLLFALAEAPGHGHGLAARIAALLPDLHAPLDGALYPALRALAASGHVAPVEGPQRPAGSGGRRRQHYRITGKGVAQLDAWRPALAALAGHGAG